MKRLLLTLCLMLCAGQARADIQTNLAQWLKLQEGTGTAAGDSSGNSKTCTLTNGPTWTTGPFTRLPAVNFDGTDDYGTSSAGSILRNGVSNDITYACWVRIVATGRNDFVIWNDSGATDAIDFYVNGSTVLEAAVQIDSGGFGVVSGATTLSISTWYHVALVKNANSWQIYLNGATDGSPLTAARTLANHGSDTLWIGSNHSAFSPSAGFNLDGQMADVRIYNRALSAADVAQLYNFRGASPVFYYHSARTFLKLNPLLSTVQ
jgi:hypothetical protein